LHPFDIKTVLFAKHAQYVVIIHFPIGLFIIGVLFDFLAQWNQEEVLPGYRLPIEAVAVAMVALTGHLGGFLSGVNGPG
jgi:uncharacterized membrane protein